MYFELKMYGHAMTETLPYEIFDWVYLHSVNIRIIKEDDECGYILEVDLVYPRNSYVKLIKTCLYALIL